MSTRKPPRSAAASPPNGGLLASIRPEALAAPESGIVELFNYGRGRDGLIPLWVGEGDLPTPSFVQDAITRSLESGETFYSPQRGLPDLRAAIARYMTATYDAPFSGAGEFSPDRFSVTTGGMHALHLAIRLVAGAGDEVLIPTPSWPNFAGALAAVGAHPVDVPLHIERTPGGATRWALDPQGITDALTARTRAIIINSPANPTGWTATHAELDGLLAVARHHGLWIIADEIYGRIVYDGRRAPSFHDVMADGDRILFVQTCSKNWSMTGLRVGWLEAPPELGQTIENLVQYSTSGVPAPIQRGATIAIETGDHFLAHQVKRFRESRDVLCDTLRATGRVHFAVPPGTFYLFCDIDGEPDTRALARRLVDEAGVGVAPGTAFGRGGESFLRLCFARNPASVREAAKRLADWLGGPQP